MDLEKIILKLEDAFLNTEVKQQVLDSYWLEQNIQNGIHTTGFCFTASEVIYRLTGGKDNWFIKSINDPRDWNHGTHYFLQNKTSGHILDITSDQYTSRGITIPYELGKARGLQNVSRKAKDLAMLSGLGEI
ncbi:hypothetical protein [Flavobacterium undicola]|uniref:hypothetical protein n=1 Tax=Flavobacterium undicola TaxID=1932779 RepID=UPI001377656B|nr:hypothetical protein [Flavobacterium undicola]MBA0883041.1 hypothetical protein [Flavobacterium undicola]